MTYSLDFLHDTTRFLVTIWRPVLHKLLFTFGGRRIRKRRPSRPPDWAIPSPTARLIFCRLYINTSPPSPCCTGRASFFTTPCGLFSPDPQQARSRPPPLPLRRPAAALLLHPVLTESHSFPQEPASCGLDRTGTMLRFHIRRLCCVVCRLESCFDTPASLILQN